ncbi:protein of unknown function [Maridesulfovibrio hydrothermalis AM13 = DSM 14728]|uniref:Uncharacterized protein n=1 Tax=Maridesulfovibrio hydrothermalis AM13 = DSM 14728 TaxID=1121451 RepID=L0RC88_9BACT|nr:protein of unknown function [Maridesulfovibrio hydrothermalis AM13 = DSM 14728]
MYGSIRGRMGVCSFLFRIKGRQSCIIFTEMGYICPYSGPYIQPQRGIKVAPYVHGCAMPAAFRCIIKAGLGFDTGSVAVAEVTAELAVKVDWLACGKFTGGAAAERKNHD